MIRWPFVSRREYEALEKQFWDMHEQALLAAEYAKHFQAELQKHHRKRDDKGRYTK